MSNQTPDRYSKVNKLRDSLYFQHYKYINFVQAFKVSTIKKPFFYRHNRHVFLFVCLNKIDQIILCKLYEDR